MTEEKFLNASQAAEYLGYTKKYIYKLVYMHALPYVKYRRFLLFREGELKEWKRKNMVSFPAASEMASKAELEFKL